MNFVPVLLLLAVTLFDAPPADAQPASNTSTFPSDVSALISIWSGLSPYEESVLLTWAGPDQDPCSGAWSGVICRCEELPARAQAAACFGANHSNATAQRRVLGLDLGPVVNAGGKRLTGRINSAIGDLHELVYLDLSQNQLT